jgi:hypothetical protein
MNVVRIRMSDRCCLFSSTRRSVTVVNPTANGRQQDNASVSNHAR